MLSTDIWKNETIELFLLEENHVTSDYVAWLNKPEVNYYLETRFNQHTQATTLAFVENAISEENILLLGIRYVPFERKHVGNIKLEINKKHGLGEIGIMLGETCVYGRGIASEAIRMISLIAREELGLRKLTAGCYESNKGSERAFMKAGFVIEGCRSDHYLCDGHYEGLTLMGLHL